VGSGSGGWGAGLGRMRAALGQEGLDAEAVDDRMVEAVGDGGGGVVDRSEVAGGSERLADRAGGGQAGRGCPFGIAVLAGIAGVVPGVSAMPMEAGAGVAFHADVGMGQGMDARQQGCGQDQDQAEEAGNPFQDVTEVRHAGMLDRPRRCQRLMG